MVVDSNRWNCWVIWELCSYFLGSNFYRDWTRWYSHWQWMKVSFITVLLWYWLFPVFLIHTLLLFLLYHCFHLHFPGNSDDEHFFFPMCPDHYMFLSFKCLLIFSPHFLHEIIIFLFLLSFESSLYVLDISPLSDVWCANIFSYSVGCHFLLVWAPLSCKNFKLM